MAFRFRKTCPFCQNSDGKLASYRKNNLFNPIFAQNKLVQQDYQPKQGLDFILKQAFFYWRKTISYQFFFSVLYLSILFNVVYFAATYLELLDDFALVYSKIPEGQKVLEHEVTKLYANPNFQTFNYYVIGVLVFLYPLNLGFYKIFRKMDLNEPTSMQDLFGGYIGSNFFRYTSYFLFWIFVYQFALPTIVLAIFWVGITLFSGPLMFFMDRRIFETLELNFKAFRRNPLEIIVGMMVAFVIKVVGMFTIIFFPFTFGFSNAMIYSLYQFIFNENEVTKN